ncbi:hypothetical protein [Desulfosporosinus sp.]|uniref:hypothetical protein n=1 Tax=Desulfosporosinus sp. TaxID=157907 RepID=UPI0025C65C35|nr:hypothetical protein [Desulfosporosinus sp.]MBC2721479.1 hypothetical protein [Desulfosporosinus sp.]MBC2726353.1 hypothetical protein [Desulfosporosinus sp.]
MTKGRATAYDDKVETIKYCIEHQIGYTETAYRFQVSYQQVYSEQINTYTMVWANFRTDVEKENLKMVVSDVEKLRAQNKLLEAENRTKQIEIHLLKKLDDMKGDGSKPGKI